MTVPAQMSTSKNKQSLQNHTENKDNPANFQFAGRQAIHSLILHYEIHLDKQSN